MKDNQLIALVVSVILLISVILVSCAPRIYEQQYNEAATQKNSLDGQNRLPTVSVGQAAQAAQNRAMANGTYYEYMRSKTLDSTNGGLSTTATPKKATSTLNTAASSAGNTLQVQANGSFWFTVYYPTWAMLPLGVNGYGMPPDQINWTGITHVVHFANGNVGTVSPYYLPAINGSDESIDYQYNGIANPQCGPSCWTDYQHMLIATAHSKGVKVLLTVQAVDCTNLNAVAHDPVKMTTFANAVVNYAEQRGYDGVEVDWEFWQGGTCTYPPAADFARLVTTMRGRMNQSATVKTLIFSAGGDQWASYDPSLDPLIDQFDLQMYDFAYAWDDVKKSNVVWYINPLHMGDAPPWPDFQGRSYDTRGPLQWVAAGHDPKKMAIGMPSFGWVFHDVNQLYQIQNNNLGYAKYQDALGLKTVGGVEGWDDQRKVSYISGTATATYGDTSWGAPGVSAGQQFFATYQSPRAVAEEVAWAKANNFGGVMMYDLTMDVDTSKPFGQRNPLHNAVIDALYNGTVPVVDTTAPTVSITSPANNSVVSGNVTITATASDNIGVAGVQFLVDGANYQAEDTTSPYNIILNTASYSNGVHTVSARARDAAGLTAMYTVNVNVNNVVSPPVNRMWFTAYYPTWAARPLGSANWAIAPNQVNWTGITHVVHFAGDDVDTVAPYFMPVTKQDVSGGDYDFRYNSQGNGCFSSCTIDYQAQLIQSAHAKGTKVLIEIGAVDPTKIKNVISDQTKTDLFADAIVTYCEQRGYDGVDIDIEGWIAPLPPKADSSRLILALRKRMNQSATVKIIAMAPGSVDYGSYDAAVVNANVDQINMQDYFGVTWNGCIRANGVWFVNPLYEIIDNPPGSYWQGTGCFEGRSISTAGPLQWVQHGFNANIVGLGVVAYGYIWGGTDVLYAAPSSQTYSTNKQCRATLSNGGIEYWDDARKVNYITGTALTNSNGLSAGQKFFVSYQSPRAVQEEIAWASAHNVSGIMLYDLTMDLDSSLPLGQNNPIHRAAAAALINSTAPPVVNDTTPPTVSITSPLNNSNVNGTVTIAATASDYYGVSSVQFRIDGASLGLINSAPYNINWDTTTTTNGFHNVSARAQDMAGNSATYIIRVNVTNIACSPGSVQGGTQCLVCNGAGNAYLQDNSKCTINQTCNVAGQCINKPVYNISSVIVYSDSLSIPWTNAGSDGGTIDLANTIHINSGTAAIMENFNDYWIFNFRYGDYWSTTKLNASYASLDFAIYTTVSTNMRVSLSYFNASNSIKTSLGSKLMTISPNAWRQISINFSELDPTGVPFNNIEFKTEAGGSNPIYLDDIVLAAPTQSDTTPPTVSISSPANNSNVNGNVTVSVTASDNIGVAGVQFLVDGTNYGSEDLSTPYVMTVNTASYANGIHTISARARDAAGNTAIYKINVNVNNTVPDVTLPTVSITAPANNSNVSGNVSVTATASDNVGVAGVQFLVDGANYGSEDTVSPYSITWNTAVYSNGWHNIAAVARDAAGNTGTSFRIRANVSNSVAPPPVGQFVTVQNGDFYFNGAPFFFGSTNAYDLPSLETFWPGNVDSRLDALAATHTDAIRIFAFQDYANYCGDSSTSGESYVMQTASGVYKESAFVALDEVIKKAKDRNIKVIVALTNSPNNHAGGGACQYLLWAGLLDAEANYDATRDSKLFYQSTVTKNMVKNYFSKIITRVNTQTGIAYKDEPAILAWEIMNEPRGGYLNDPVMLRDWLREMAQYIKGLDTNHLVGTGEEGMDDNEAAYPQYLLNAYAGAYNGEEGTSFTLNTQIPEIDFSSIHLYPQLTFPSVANLTYGGLLYIEAHNNISRLYNKPMIIGEYGMSGDENRWWYNLANDPVKLTTYNTWWRYIEAKPGIAGDFMWQVLDDGAPYWLAGSGANVYYTGDSLIWPAYLQHNNNMRIKTGGTIPPDTQAPTVTITSPANNSNASNTVTITASATDNVGVVGVQFLVDGANYGSEDTVSPYSITWNTASYGNGWHNISARARDAAGNMGTSFRIQISVNNTVIIPDTLPPSVNVSSPANNSVVNGTVTISAVASDNVGVVGVQFLVDGANYGSEDTTSPYSITWNTASYNDGGHNLSARARDAAGNSMTSFIIRVNVSNTVVDVTPPLLNVTHSPLNPVGGQIVTFVATVSDPSGINGVNIYVNNTLVTGSCNSNGTSWTCSYVSSFANNTNVTYYATATDSSANHNLARDPSAGTKSLYVSMPSADTTPPTVSIITPANNSAVSGQTWINATASDNVAVAGVQLQIDGLNLGIELGTSPYALIWNTSASGNGAHQLRARARDAAGNIALSSIILANVNNGVAPPPPPSGGGGGSHGGGGGGGGGYVGPIIPPNVSKNHTFSKYIPVIDASYTLDVPVVLLDMSTIVIKVPRIVLGITITVDQPKDVVVESSFDSVYAGRYRYAQLIIGHDGLEDANVTGSDIFFSINESWLNEHKLTADMVALYRYDKHMWQQLETSYVRKSFDKEIFKAVSPGLSVFMIGSKEIPASAPGEQQAPEETDQGNQTKETTAFGPMNDSGRALVIIISLAVMMLGIMGLAIFLIMRAKIKDDTIAVPPSNEAMIPAGKQDFKAKVDDFLDSLRKEYDEESKYIQQKYSKQMDLLRASGAPQEKLVELDSRYKNEMTILNLKYKEKIASLEKSTK